MLQTKLQVLTIQECVTRSTYSPTSPNVEEPFQSLVKDRQENENEQSFVSGEVLIPLDKVNVFISRQNSLELIELSSTKDDER